MFILCLKVFFVRIIDVSLGTIRTIFTIKSKKLFASFIGFFEIFIWFLVVKEALQTEEDSIFIAISYSLGFATGTYLGSLLSDILIKGKISIQVFTSDLSLEKQLRKKGYALSTIKCTGYNSSIKHLLNILIDKSKEKKLRNIIKKLDNNAFIVEAETAYVENGYFK